MAAWIGKLLALFCPLARRRQKSLHQLRRIEFRFEKLARDFIYSYSLRIIESSQSLNEFLNFEQHSAPLSRMLYSSLPGSVSTNLQLGEKIYASLSEKALRAARRAAALNSSLSA